MKRKFKLLAALVVVGAIAASGMAAWWLIQDKPAKSTKAPAEMRPLKYVTLEKVVVMLRRNPGEQITHYLAADLVFTTTDLKEKTTKEHLPMLRSVAVRALSAYPMEKAEAMTVDQFAAEIDRAFTAHYARDGREKPFSEIMLGKLIIE